MSREKIEEMAKILSEDCGSCENCKALGTTDNGIDCTNYYYARQLYNAGYRKQEWISVDERLPERAGKYLVATFDGRVGIGNLIDYYCDGDLSFDNYKVTHWLPLPEAPKMKGGAE